MNKVIRKQENSWEEGVEVCKDTRKSEYEAGMKLGCRRQGWLRAEVGTRAGYLELQVRKGRLVFRSVMHSPVAHQVVVFSSAWF